MKKLPLLITIGLVVLLVGGYFAFKYFEKKPVRPWDLIPTDALLVYERDNCNTCVADVTKTSLWNVLQRATIGNDSLLAKVTTAIERASGLLVSVHATKKDEFDFVYYLRSSAPLLSSLTSANQSGYKTKSRLFNGITINELQFGKRIFSFANFEGVVVGSFTPFLVEDVIRTHTLDGRAGKQDTFGALQFTSIKDDAGNLYVRLDAMQELLSLLIDVTPFRFAVGKSALLDIKADEGSITFNGFSTDSINQANYFLSVFSHQTPVPLSIKNYISNRAVSVAGFGISNGLQFEKDRLAFVKANRRNLRDSLDVLLKKHNVDVTNLFAKVSDEIAVCFFENRKNDFSKILLVETSDVRPWQQSLNVLAERLSIDTVFYERYSQYAIREVPIYKFSEKLLWPLVSGFENNFYTTVGNILVIAEDIEQLKDFLDDIDADETWARSVAQNRFLESTLLESNVSLFVNTGKFLNAYASKFHPKWESFLKANRKQVQALQMSSIQFSHLNNSYYTNALFTFKPSTQSAEAIPSRGTVTIFERGISSIAAVRSHVNRSNEILVQDSVNDISLVAADGKVLWKVPLGERIVSEISQVDFFNNGKLQYFFATQFSLHVIDRLGNYVNGYPTAHNITDLAYATVVDYDNSKKYRFLLSDKSGKVYMFDKDPSLLEGWRANDAGGELIASPRHFRIKGKDYIVAARKDGTVMLWTRRGEMLKNFPMKLESEPMGDIFLERGNTLDETFFVFVTRDGFRNRITVNGKLQSKETLLKNSIRSTFYLIPDKAGKSYVIAQQDERELSISDAEGKRIMAAPITGTGPGDVEFYDNGGGKIFITARDNTQRLYYVFDGQGNLLTTPPLESTMLEIRPQDSDNFTLFFIHDRSLVVQPL